MATENRTRRSGRSHHGHAATLSVWAADTALLAQQMDGKLGSSVNAAAGAIQNPSHIFIRYAKLGGYFAGCLAGSGTLLGTGPQGFWERKP